MIEELVELLVRVVDAELLEGIRLEVFEPKNVQNTDELGAVLSCENKSKKVLIRSSSPLSRNACNCPITHI